MSEVQALENQLQEAQAVIERMEAAKRLFENKDFKKVILEEFCEKECAKYAHASADPNLPAESRADALALAQASGHLRRYLSVVIRMGEHMEREQVELREALDAARMED